MKCLKCNSEMEKGYISHVNTWLKDNQNFMINLDKKLTGMVTKNPAVIAWKCPKCNKIELEAEEK